MDSDFVKTFVREAFRIKKTAEPKKDPRLLVALKRRIGDTRRRIDARR